MALGTDIGPFFANQPPASAGWIFRRHQMGATTDPRRCYTFVLPARTDIRLLMLDEELFAGEDPEFESLTGDLAGYVLAGELRLELTGEEPQVLQPGDAFYLPAGRPARGCCAGGTSVRLVTVQVLEKGQRGETRHRGNLGATARGSIRSKPATSSHRAQFRKLSWYWSCWR